MDEIRAYQAEAARKSDFERTEVVKEKTGVRLEGVSAINPLTGKEIPIFISDYVLVSYGTGAIMAVPAHDTRDWEFAKEIQSAHYRSGKGRRRGEGSLYRLRNRHHGQFRHFGRPERGRRQERALLNTSTEKGIGHAKVNFKLRDWVFSRQRYWGEPIPDGILREVRLCSAARGASCR